MLAAAKTTGSTRSAAGAVDPYCAIELCRADRGALVRAAQLGFRQALSALPSGGDNADEAVREYALQCVSCGLEPYLDLRVDCAGADDSPVREFPSAYSRAPYLGDAILDPRRELPPAAESWLRGSVPSELAQWWHARLALWLDLGIKGFRLMSPQRVPRRFLQTLIARAKAHTATCRFLAWTPGLSPAQIHALADCGFDAAFLHVDGNYAASDSFLEKLARLRRIAAPLGYVNSESPASPAALWCASTIGGGILLAENALERDFAPTLADINRLSKSPPLQSPAAEFRRLSSPGAEVLALLRSERNGASAQRETLLLLINPHADRAALGSPSAWLAHADGSLQDLQDAATNEPVIDWATAENLKLAPGEVRVLRGRSMPAVTAAQSKVALDAGLRAPRIVIENLQPAIDGGRFPVKRLAGSRVEVEADVFMDGHDQFAVELLWRADDAKDLRRSRMRFIGNDRWAASFPLTRMVRHAFTVEAWRDSFGTFRHDFGKKREAGVDLRLEIEEGRQLVEQTRRSAKPEAAKALGVLCDELAQATPAEAIKLLLSDPLAEAMAAADPRAFCVRHEPRFVEAERSAAGFAAWYELFPRSQSPDPARHGSLRDTIAQLPRIRDMGFDVLYLPPIHPIGQTNRKGPNNSLTAGSSDPGSPYAIGSVEGGYDAIHPLLGTLEDFRALRDAAAGHGLELALDFAIQCSPDHPWLKAHPQWFSRRPDGSIRYAENPPKKYQDIHNVDFYAAAAVPDLWIALRDVVLFWAREGVRLFRVDNPHTKPLPFWEWMIAEVRAQYPDAVFLSEAFTRPKLMQRLAKIGFSQSYTYFTWRNTKQELTTYLEELTQTEVREYLRPHFFVNTPDINPLFLQTSGRAGFLIRAALAATLSGLWGMYSGFEICESSPLPGREEYLDSEKYQLRHRDWRAPGNIVAEITQLNRIRRNNPALWSHLNLRFYQALHDQILWFGKSTPNRDNVLLIAINLDPHKAHEAAIEIPLWEWGLPDDGRLAAENLITGERHVWHGKNQHLRLDPTDLPYAIWRVGVPT